AIMMQICDGLKAAHEKGVIHRDLKPENIMITPDGVVKIMDFGGARLSTVEPTIKDWQDQDKGSRGYVAPEQWRNEKADVRNDIYALGLILRYLIGDAAAPAHIRAAIERCVETLPEKRFV